MDYYKVSFALHNNTEITDILSFELGEIGFESFDESNENFNAYIPVTNFIETDLIEINNRYSNILNFSYTQFITIQFIEKPFGELLEF